MVNIKRIIAVILILILIVYKFLIGRKYSVKKTYVAKKEKRITIFLTICSILVFGIVLLINIESNGEVLDINTVADYIFGALAIAILVMPINMISLYKMMFDDEEKYCNVKTIITNVISEKAIEKFNKAHINVIVVSKKKNKLKLKTIEEDEVNRSVISKNIIIRSDSLKIVDKYINKEIVLYESKDIDKLYEKIMEARGVYDNYIRIIKYLVITYLPLVLSYFLLTIEGFPFVYDILLVVLLKIITLLVVNGVYKKMPYDKDIETRYSKEPKMFMGRQEFMFMIAQGFINLFLTTVPYMLVLSEGGDIKLAFSLYVLINLFANLFGTYSMINDSFIVKIVFKNIKNVRLVIYSVILIIVTILFNYVNVFNTINVGVKNYFACLVFGIATITLNEFIKLARYNGVRRRRKNELKNNR